MRKRLTLGSFYMGGKQLQATMLAHVGSDKGIELYFELPDPVFGFNTSCTIDNDTTVIKQREGFNIIRNNRKFVSEIALEGKNYAIV